MKKETEEIRVGLRGSFKEDKENDEVPSWREWELESRAAVRNWRFVFVFLFLETENRANLARGELYFSESKIHSLCSPIFIILEREKQGVPKKAN